jgi:C-terminal processing protease CtpA/Prc
LKLFFLQDTFDPKKTMIIIRSLVPGGVAHIDGRLEPGDRLVSVNGVNVFNASLDVAVQSLTGAPKGIVRLSVFKPERFGESSTDHDQVCTQTSRFEAWFTFVIKRVVHVQCVVRHLSVNSVL